MFTTKDLHVFTLGAGLTTDQVNHTGGRARQSEDLRPPMFMHRECTGQYASRSNSHERCVDKTTSSPSVDELESSCLKRKVSQIYNGIAYVKNSIRHLASGVSHPEAGSDAHLVRSYFQGSDSFFGSITENKADVLSQIVEKIALYHSKVETQAHPLSLLLQPLFQQTSDLHLCMAQQKITALRLPAGIYSQLQHLDLSGNNLVTLPDLPPALTLLNLSKNQFSELPCATLALTELRVLDISHNLLNNALDRIRSKHTACLRAAFWPRLEVIDLSHNPQLSSLGFVFYLTSLKVIKAFRTKIHTVETEGIYQHHFFSPESPNFLINIPYQANKAHKVMSLLWAAFICKKTGIANRSALQRSPFPVNKEKWRVLAQSTNFLPWLEKLLQVCSKSAMPTDTFCFIVDQLQFLANSPLGQCYLFFSDQDLEEDQALLKLFEISIAQDVTHEVDQLAISVYPQYAGALMHNGWFALKSEQSREFSLAELPEYTQTQAHESILSFVKMTGFLGLMKKYLESCSRSFVPELVCTEAQRVDILYHLLAHFNLPKEWKEFELQHPNRLDLESLPIYKTIQKDLQDKDSLICLIKSLPSTSLVKQLLQPFKWSQHRIKSSLRDRLIRTQKKNITSERLFFSSFFRSSSKDLSGVFEPKTFNARTPVQQELIRLAEMVFFD